MDLKLNADRFTGKNYINTYDKYRPSPPMEIIHQTLNYLGSTEAKKVADLGCGTGISTRAWSGFAQEIIGIEPSEEMLSIAKEKNGVDRNISYLKGYSFDIPLPSNSVDIISCSQSFHWMHPENTLTEVNRILKNNGIFVVYNVIWSTSVNYEFESSYKELFAKIDILTRELQEAICHQWDKNDHLKNIEESNFFKFSKETYFHKTKELSKEEFIGIALSQGGLEALIKRGLSNEEIGIVQFEKKIENAKQPPFNNVTYNYRAIFAIK